MFGTLKLSFDVDILTYFGSFGLFLKNWGFFYSSSGHPVHILQSSMMLLTSFQLKQSLEVGNGQVQSHKYPGQRD
jgi:hypothetical protein